MEKVAWLGSLFAHYLHKICTACTIVRINSNWENRRIILLRKLRAFSLVFYIPISRKYFSTSLIFFNYFWSCLRWTKCFLCCVLLLWILKLNHFLSYFLAHTLFFIKSIMTSDLSLFFQKFFYKIDNNVLHVVIFRHVCLDFFQE